MIQNNSNTNTYALISKNIRVFILSRYCWFDAYLDSNQYQLIKNAIKGFSSFTRDLSYNVDKARESALDVLHASLLVFAGDEETLLKIADEQTEFLKEYQIFKRSRKQLAAIDPELPKLLNICLKCMSHFKISLS